MAGFRLPTIPGKRIDVSKYGGEGFLYVRPAKGIDNIEMLDYIAECARKDGVPCDTNEQLQTLMTTRYRFKATRFSMRCSTYVEDDEGKFRPITEEEFSELPLELIAEIMKAVEEGSKFPLAQKGGKAQK